MSVLDVLYLTPAYIDCLRHVLVPKMDGAHCRWSRSARNRSWVPNPFNYFQLCHLACPYSGSRIISRSPRGPDGLPSSVVLPLELHTKAAAFERKDAASKPAVVQSSVRRQQQLRGHFNGRRLSTRQPLFSVSTTVGRAGVAAVGGRGVGKAECQKSRVVHVWLADEVLDGAPIGNYRLPGLGLSSRKTARRSGNWGCSPRSIQGASPKRPLAKHA
ncbi:hypothetical protein GQ43DRAFT_128104 [Delitschia confertaspora ATCC 74209]|uniref:Uncharacterized protein n=1 Tax=Delitschia confertaspora ATCC 74209 TaxID=1513339 RepID=A0A9P4JH64_9PLEO|nr:hypothetical protein GQ43DRAFT_128104 [Delitschia confertaspora ATCC 74209]